MKMINLRNIILSLAENIFLNSTENMVRSKALDLSILQTKTSESFLRKYSSVSTTAQVHMTEEMPLF